MITNLELSSRTAYVYHREESAQRTEDLTLILLTYKTEGSVRPIDSPRRVRQVISTRTSSRMGAAVEEYRTTVHEVPLGLYLIIVDNVSYRLDIRDTKILVLTQPIGIRGWVIEDSEVIKGPPFPLEIPRVCSINTVGEAPVEPDPPLEPEAKNAWAHLLDD